MLIYRKSFIVLQWCRRSIVLTHIALNTKMKVVQSQKLGYFLSDKLIMNIVGVGDISATPKRETFFQSISLIIRNLCSS